ncbi:MAG: hypothetical protein AMJ55_03880 [Gammaproteobacteria bacterium SG8_15]|nr:MAG: hypothetical protein AMJ55_03880 [Gammaproteobacteria bacterium SG8_15]
MLTDKFAPLKNMDPFTNDMFNRVIAFQEKDHPAWNTALDFATRIQGLPLHNLIFSNPDRDPTKYGPTVAAYYPLREEMQKLAAYAKQLSANPLVYDWYPGNGFIGSLLAREGLSVTGIQGNNVKDNQIMSFFDSDIYQFTERTHTAASCDVVLASWIPSQLNPTPEILAQQPKLIAYVYTEHVDESSGQRQTGTDDMFDTLADHYRLLDSWTVHRPKNLLHDIWPDMTPSIEEMRITRVYAANEVSLEKLHSIESKPPYDWEVDLRMALLALEAKQELRARGMNV